MGIGECFYYELVFTKCYLLVESFKIVLRL